MNTEYRSQNSEGKRLGSPFLSHLFFLTVVYYLSVNSNVAEDKLRIQN